ncbi:hypothetical protein V8E55_003916 [Tylopilus felleus]
MECSLASCVIQPRAILICWYILLTSSLAHQRSGTRQRKRLPSWLAVKHIGQHTVHRRAPVHSQALAHLLEGIDGELVVNVSVRGGLTLHASTKIPGPPERSERCQFRTATLACALRTLGHHLLEGCDFVVEDI